MREYYPNTQRTHLRDAVKDFLATMDQVKKGILTLTDDEVIDKTVRLLEKAASI